jgi:hypothetical protein
MIITDQFVFAHIPKTGGMFLQSVIGRFFAVMEVRQGNDSHHSVEFLAPEHRTKPIFALVRNPWSWYVSWFHFCERQGDNPEFTRNHVQGPRAFVETITRLLTPNHSDASINQFMREQDMGLMEMHRFHILDLENQAHDLTQGRLEFLAQDFLDFLHVKSIPVPQGLPSALHGKPSNSSGHGPWRNYYDEPLRALVVRKERAIVRLGGYCFEGEEPAL